MEGPLDVGAGAIAGVVAATTKPRHGARRELAMKDAKNEKMNGNGQEDRSHDRMMYLRFGAMVLTATVVMYGLTYVNTYALDHVRWSEERAYMMLVMGGSMALIMLGFMWMMLKNLKLNAAIIMAGVTMIAIGLFLVRTETTIQDRSYMSAMIPHHSIAILTSEHSEIRDVRVCELAVGIIKAQRQEISEMDWLIEDIGESGLATTVAEAEERAVPKFPGTSERSCPTS